MWLSTSIVLRRLRALHLAGRGTCGNKAGAQEGPSCGITSERRPSGGADSEAATRAQGSEQPRPARGHPPGSFSHAVFEMFQTSRKAGRIIQ